MRQERACPYYGRDEERCDVGHGYISPHDVEVMVRHCMSRYEDCGRYAELRDAGAAAGRPAAVARSGEPLEAFPAAIDSEAMASIHHELRTPLTSIRSFAEILLRHPGDNADSRLRFLRIIRDEAERLTRTVDAWFGTPDRDGDCHRFPGTTVERPRRTDGRRLAETASLDAERNQRA